MPKSYKQSILNFLSICCFLGLVACDDSTSNSSNDDPLMVPRAGDDITMAGQEIQPNPEAFLERISINDMASGPAFTTIADMNADGKLDLIVSEFGPVGGFSIEPGRVSVYYQGDSLQEWTVEEITNDAEPLYWPNSVEIADLDGDGDLDLTVGAGFLICEILPRIDPNGQMIPPGPCGALLWYEQADGQWIRHDIQGSDSNLFYHHGLLADLDNDGIDDLITVGERRYFDNGNLVDQAQTQWFKGQAMGERFETTAREIGAGMGSLAELHDLDGDGDLDIVSAEFFAPFETKSFAWFEQLTAPTGTANNANDTGTWQRHVIDDQVGPAIQFSLIEDLFGDGQIKGVGSNHTQTTGDEPDPWASAVFVYDLPNDLQAKWTGRQVSQNIVSLPRDNQAAPGIFGVGDVNGDERKDILVSGDGDSRVFVLLQDENQGFETWVLDENLPQAGSMKVKDLNGDGQQELIVTSYDQNVIYLYRLSSNGTYPLRLAEMPEWANGDVNTAGTDMAGMEVEGGTQAGAQAGTEGGTTTGELIPSNSDLLIKYNGSENGPLVVAAFSSWPPLGPPSAFEQRPTPNYPEAIDFPNLSAGTYTILAFIDVDNSGPMMPTDADVQVQVEVDFPRMEAAEINLDGSNSPSNPMLEGLEVITDTVNRVGRNTPVKVLIPEGGASYPMIVFTPGFQLQSSYYAPMLEALAQAGYIVMSADPPGTLFDVNHIEMAADVRAAIDWSLSSTFANRIDQTKIATMGHSLGGKLALFNAAEDSRVIASLALDPVDGDPSPLPDPSIRPTLADSLLGQITGAVGLIGELTNAEPANAFAPACAPRDNNFQTIFSALNNASWLLEWELVGADHMDFVSSCPGGLFSPCSACTEGTMAPSRVLELSSQFAEAFFALHLKGDSNRESELVNQSDSDVNVRQR